MSKTTITKACMACKGTRSVTVFEHDIKKHHRGALVQDVWPDMSSDDREVMIAYRTGMYMCPSCWGADE